MSTDDVGRAGEPWQTTTAFVLLLVVAGWALLGIVVFGVGALFGEPVDPTVSPLEPFLTVLPIGIAAVVAAFGVRAGRVWAVPPAVGLGVLAVLGGVAETVNWPWDTGADGLELTGIQPAVLGGFVVYGVLSPAHRRRARALRAGRG